MSFFCALLPNCFVALLPLDASYAIHVPLASTGCAPIDPNCFPFRLVRCLPKTGHFCPNLKHLQSSYFQHLMAGSRVSWGLRESPRPCPPASGLTRSKSRAISPPSTLWNNFLFAGFLLPIHTEESPRAAAAPPPAPAESLPPRKFPSPPR